MTPVFPEQQVTPVFPDETHRSRKREVEGAGSAAPLVSRLLLKPGTSGFDPGAVLSSGPLPMPWHRGTPTCRG